VGWGGATSPAVLGAEEDVERFGLVDVAGPEEADVAVSEAAFAGADFDGELDDTIGEEFVALAAFELVEERRGLAEFGGVAADEAEFHGMVARFELGFAVRGNGAVEDVFEVDDGFDIAAGEDDVGLGGAGEGEVRLRERGGEEKGNEQRHGTIICQNRRPISIDATGDAPVHCYHWRRTSPPLVIRHSAGFIDAFPVGVPG
jgi:hypothetical protein